MQLPINILNEKLYLFLWFWFYLLAIVTLLALVYRLLTLAFPFCRALSIRLQTGRTLDWKLIKSVLADGDLGHWFLLHLLAKNMLSVHFQALMVSLEDDKKVINDD